MGYLRLPFFNDDFLNGSRKLLEERAIKNIPLNTNIDQIIVAVVITLVLAFLARFGEIILNFFINLCPKNANDVPIMMYAVENVYPKYLSNFRWFPKLNHLIVK